MYIFPTCCFLVVSSLSSPIALATVLFVPLCLQRFVLRWLLRARALAINNTGRAKADCHITYEMPYLPMQCFLALL